MLLLWWPLNHLLLHHHQQTMDLNLSSSLYFLRHKDNRLKLSLKQLQTLQQQMNQTYLLYLEGLQQHLQLPLQQQLVLKLYWVDFNNQQKLQPQQLINL